MGEQGCCCLNTWQIRLPPEYQRNPQHTSDGPSEVEGKSEGERSYSFWWMGLTATLRVRLGETHGNITQHRSNNDLDKLYRGLGVYFGKANQNMVWGEWLCKACKSYSGIHEDRYTKRHIYTSQGIKRGYCYYYFFFFAFQGRDISIFIREARRDGWPHLKICINLKGKSEKWKNDQPSRWSVCGWSDFMEVSDGMRKYRVERTKTVKQDGVAKDPVWSLWQTSEVMQTDSIREGNPLLTITPKSFCCN